MPMKITPDDAYNDASDTLRVGRHDLERLLLEFRELLREALGHEAGCQRCLRAACSGGSGAAPGLCAVPWSRLEMLLLPGSLPLFAGQARRLEVAEGDR